MDGVLHSVVGVLSGPLDSNDLHGHGATGSGNLGDSLGPGFVHFKPGIDNSMDMTPRKMAGGVSHLVEVVLRRVEDLDLDGSLIVAPEERN